MNKIYLGLSAIALIVGVMSASVVKAGAAGTTFWTIVSTHMRVNFGTAILACPGGAYLCAIQYTTASYLRTGYVRYKVL